ncbi:MAG: GNAT family N-acetyltransferase [Aigarchaeota archaeon]|nr:GNAT family N-acetyltransferase [Aigarchaeota archaeon]MDH5703806.1 GNAT family N-acetyltransferase [Aigarchaeota archaeon]
MANVRIATVEDIRGLMDCHTLVWQSLGEVLPADWIQEEIDLVHRTEAEEMLRRVIEDPERITLVAVEEGKIVGFAMGRSDKSSLSWLSFMGVSSSHRRRGIGRGLVQKYVEESRLRGARKVSLNTAPELEPAVKLYVDMGFIPEGLLRRHRYGMDLIVYSKFLG